jgi:hypothetical protein
MPDVTITIPDGPIVAYDPAAMRAWLATPFGHNGETTASDADISVDNIYTPESCNPGDWLDCLLLRIGQQSPPCPAWQVQPGVAIEAHHTADFEGDAGDGGAVIIVDLGHGHRFTTGKLDRDDLVVNDYEPKTEVDAAVEAFQSAADAINNLFQAIARNA